MARLEWVLERTIFPLILGGGIAFSITRMNAGHNEALAVLPPLIFAYVAIATLERVFFWRTEWLHSNGDLKVDIGHFLVSGIFTNQALSIPATALSVVLATWLADLTGGSFWPTHLSLWIQLPIALVVGEFFLYWVHRLTHEVDFLWRFHAVHHSAPRLYFFNAVRFHPVDLAVSAFAPLIPLVMIGADARIIALHGMVSAIHGLFQHANLKLKLGPLNWFFSMAELHRWHHSRNLEEANTNFGQNLIVWDIVFGTRFLPKDREPPSEIGLAGLPTFPMDYWGQLLSPIRWKAIRASSEAAIDAVDRSDAINGAAPVDRSESGSSAQ